MAGRLLDEDALLDAKTLLYYRPTSLKLAQIQTIFLTSPFVFFVVVMVI